MIIRVEIIVRAVQVVIQRTSLFGALTVNLTVVVRVRFVVDGSAATQDEHAVHESVFATGKIGVECGEFCRIDTKLLWSSFRPILGTSGLLGDRGDGDRA